MTATRAVAVIGMAVRLPGADDVGAFWQNVLRRMPVHRVRPTDPARFDAAFFGMGPQEAACTDPQHRMFLECCWHAAEAAGYDPQALPGVGAVFGGCSLPAYLIRNLVSHHQLVERYGPLPIALVNDRDGLTARVANLLDLRGPCPAVLAFSATGLVAVHLAVQSLLLGECDVALAGAASVRLPGVPTEPSVTSRSGRCAPFDARADGTVFGSGTAVVVLRRLDDAVRDQDHVHALIDGSAVASEGRRPGFLVPGLSGTPDAIVEALAVAGVDPDDIGYIEAQAMGSIVPDATELRALNAVFGEVATGPRYLGTVAANVGHLDATAGMAGLIKAILAVEHGVIPPQPEFQVPAPALAVSLSGFVVPTTARRWGPGPARPGAPRRAGVNSVGLGGTHVHVVVSQAPADPPVEEPAEPALFILSARDPTALTLAARNLHTALAGYWSDPAGERAPVPAPADVAYTLQVGRAELPLRAGFIAVTRRGVLRGLRRLAKAGAPARALVEIAEPAAGRRGRAGAKPDWMAAGRRWVAGDRVDWRALHQGRNRRRVPLPGYPFHRGRHWIEPGRPTDWNTDDDLPWTTGWVTTGTTMRRDTRTCHESEWSARV